jgi:hypothetical protein
LIGAYVVDSTTEAKLKSQGFALSISINPEMFFK